MRFRKFERRNPFTPPHDRDTSINQPRDLAANCRPDDERRPNSSQGTRHGQPRDCTLTGDDILRLADKLDKMSTAPGRAFFARDAANLRQSGAVVLIGSRYSPLGLNCGWCGFPTCAAKTEQAPEAPCAFNTHDLGIAVGSAVSIAADHRADCRVLYSAGVGALALNLLPGCKAVLAIPLSSTGKSPFFDRKPL